MEHQIREDQNKAYARPVVLPFDTKYIRATTYFNILFLILGSICLLLTQGSCDSPVRLWLQVYIVISGCLTLIQVFVDLMTYMNLLSVNWIVGIMLASMIIGAIFSAVWMITGSIWLFQDTACNEGNVQVEEPFLWYLSFAILMIFYIALLLSFALCVLAFLAGRKKPEENLKEDVINSEDKKDASAHLIASTIDYGTLDNIDEW